MAGPVIQPLNRHQVFIPLSPRSLESRDKAKRQTSHLCLVPRKSLSFPVSVGPQHAAAVS